MNQSGAIFKLFVNFFFSFTDVTLTEKRTREPINTIVTKPTLDCFLNQHRIQFKPKRRERPNSLFFLSRPDIK